MANDQPSTPRLFPGVMISSTFKDLKKHRAALMDALKRQKLHPIAMEDYELVPNDDIISSSLRMVGEGSAYVGLISHRYGQVLEDPKRNPHSYSVSRLEFEEAQRLGLPTLIFVMGDQHPGIKGDFETDSNKEKALAAYREHAKAGRIYIVFNSLEEFTPHAIHAAANLRNFLEQSSKTKAPAPAPVPASPSLLSEVCALEETDLVQSIFEQRWTLAQLLQAMDGSPQRAFEFIRAIGSPLSGTWRHYLAAYVASKIEIPAGEFISLALGPDLAWGSRTAILTLLRFTPRSKRHAAAVLLTESADQRGALPEMDRQRLAILGLGYLDGQSTIQWILEKYNALKSTYENEKLGPYALLAYLHCYIESTTEAEEHNALRAFTRTAEANKQHANDTLGFYDYRDEFQTLRPGKAVALFRHFRDQQHNAALSGLLARLSNCPNPLLVSELIALGNSASDSGIAAGALHAAAYSGTPKAESALAQAASDHRPGARAALLLAQGIRRNPDAKAGLEAILNAPKAPDSSWLNDLRGNAIWSIGELGRDDRAFARQLLDPIRENPDDAYERGLALLGLAKAGCLLSSEEIDTGMDIATKFYERITIAIAGALAGWPQALNAGLKGMIENAGPPFGLFAHIQRDLYTALNKHSGEGGKDLVTLWEMGDFN